MYTLKLPPDQAGYSVSAGDEVIATKLDGGASRTRLDILNAANNVSCAWTVGPDDYRYLRRFYAINVKNGGESFLLDLILDEPFPTEYTCKFIPGTWSLQSQKGHTYVVACQLEIEGDLKDLDYDEALMMLESEYGSLDEALIVLNMLEKLVNYDIPGRAYNG